MPPLTAPASRRADVLTLLRGQRPARAPRFSGLISVTQSGLESVGLRFSETHTDAEKMAAAATTSHRLFGFASATAPLDMCVEAEALGALVDFRADADEPLFPIPAAPLAADPASLSLPLPAHILHLGRLPIVCEALTRLKDSVGATAAVGAWVPGPFTLALQIMPVNAVLMEVARAPEQVARVLAPLTALLMEVAAAYRAAGADFITVHEMGGSPGVIGPRAFETLVLPCLQTLLAALPAPRVLSVCGRAGRALPLLAAAGAEAISVDQQTNLAQARATLGPEALLFGNIDPVGVLAHGSPAEVRQAVRAAIASGADAVWPGCDLWPATPAENIRAMMKDEG